MARGILTFGSSQSTSRTMAEGHPLLRSDTLRNAVYKNRSATRALRHNITRACIPCAMLPAVASWLAPWDAVTPDAALKDLKSLELVFNGPLMRQRLDDPDTLVTQEDTRSTTSEQIKEATDAMQQIIDCARRCDPSGKHDGVPFSKVQSLTLSIPPNIWRGGYDLTREIPRQLRMILAFLPALRSFTCPRPPCSGAAMWWTPQVVEREDGPPMISNIPVQSPSRGRQEVAEFLDHLPRLTSVDIRDYAGELHKSLLLSRGSLRRIATRFDYVPYILNVMEDQEDPVAKAPVEVSHITAADLAECHTINTTNPSVPQSVFRFVPHTETLENVVLTEVKYNSFTMPLLARFVKCCPRLTSLRLAATRSSHADLRHHPFAVKPAAAFALGHATINEILAATTADHPRLTKSFSASKLETLRSMASSGVYPTVLWIALARGVALTSLRSVSFDGAVSNEMAEAADAALAAVTCLHRDPTAVN